VSQVPGLISRESRHYFRRTLTYLIKAHKRNR